MTKTGFENTFCTECGRLLESDFVYCPWCGQEKEVFAECSENKIENAKKDYKIQKINAMTKKINELEQELNVLVLNAEMKK